MSKLLVTGKTDLLDQFVSMRTRRGFKAMLAWDATAGKVKFEFAPSKFPPRKTTAKSAIASPVASKTVAKKPTPTMATAKKTPAKKTQVKNAASAKTPRKTSTAAGLQPSAALAAVIGSEAVARTQVIKKLWDYIKANKLQDAKDKRSITADAKLLPVFGKPQVTMFELARIVGKHLAAGG